MTAEQQVIIWLCHADTNGIRRAELLKLSNIEKRIGLPKEFLYDMLRSVRGDVKKGKQYTENATFYFNEKRVTPHLLKLEKFFGMFGYKREGGSNG